MTKNQITKKLLKSGIEINDSLEISINSIMVCVGYFKNNGYGACNEKETLELTEKIENIMGWETEYSTQYGSNIITPNKREDKGDYNDKSSAYHY